MLVKALSSLFQLVINIGKDHSKYDLASYAQMKVISIDTTGGAPGPGGPPRC